jgi:hypothetical protein
MVKEKEKLTRAILKNLHESLKWLWLIIMGLSLVHAIEVYAELLDLRDAENPLDVAMMFITEHTLVFISFILIFIRFSFGNNRFIDLSYDEKQYRQGLKVELYKYSGRKRTFDIMLLLSQGIFFYFMSFHIGNSAYYSYFFVIFMVVNVLWLIFQLKSKINAKDPKPDLLIGNMSGSQVLENWCINNFLFVVIMVCIIASGLPYKVLICIGLTILNSVVDFCLTWRYYFPSLRDIYEFEHNEEGG